MPGPVSESSKGAQDGAPYVPSWCYADNAPPVCACGHHHGYHNDAGDCNQAHRCGCLGYVGADPDAQGEGARP